MSAINPGNNLQFKSVDSLFARVRRRLKSYNSAGILDEGDWYYYIKEVLDRLGVGVYDEAEAVVYVKNFKGPMPDNFSFLYAAYKCTPSFSTGQSKNTLFPQTGMVFYIDETYQRYKQSHCSAQRCTTGEKITIRYYIEGTPTDIKLSEPRLLKLSGNVKTICDDKCQNLFCRAGDEMRIDGDFLYTNFESDAILLKYYAFPLDVETGLPMIPDDSVLQKAIEDYIVYRIFEDFWFNGLVPDIENKYKVARLNSDDSMKSALYLVKLPSFQSAINHIRQTRKNLRAYQM
jgi:hypothetical protein